MAGVVEAAVGQMKFARMLSGENDRAQRARQHQRRRRRRRRAGLGRDAAAHVHALVRAQGLQDRDARPPARRRGGHQDGLVHRRGRLGVRLSARGERRASPGAHLAVRRQRAPPDRRSPPSSSIPISTRPSRSRSATRTRGADLPLGRRRRAARQQDRVGGALHPQADRHRRRLPDRALAAQEPLDRR